MALTLPKVGSRHTLTDSAGIGQGVGAVRVGTVVTVESVHKTQEPGVTGDLIVSFPSETTPDAERRLSLSLAEFKSKFTAAGD